MIQENVGSNWPTSPVKVEYENDADVVRLTEQLRANSRDSRDAMAAGTTAGAIEGSLLGIGSSRYNLTSNRAQYHSNMLPPTADDKRVDDKQYRDARAYLSNTQQTAQDIRS